MFDDFGFKVVFNSDLKVYELYDLCNDGSYQYICCFCSRIEALMCLSDRIHNMIVCSL